MLKKSILLFLLSIHYCCNGQDGTMTSNTKQINSNSSEKIDSLGNLGSKNLNDLLTKEFVLGRFDYTKDSTFVKVSKEYSNKTIYLKKEAYQAFLKMTEAAKREGITFTILSGTRNFEHQKSIWERKWERYSNLEPEERIKKIMEYSSMPSTSRHHWGSDMDFNSLNNEYFSKGKGLKEYQWLNENAHKFGFRQTYSDKTAENRTGYEMEKWHWSYMPLAKRYLAFYNKNVDYDDIKGFSGSELAEKLGVIDKYVNGISIHSLRYNALTPVKSVMMPIKLSND